MGKSGNDTHGKGNKAICFPSFCRGNYNSNILPFMAMADLGGRMVPGKQQQQQQQPRSSASTHVHWEGAFRQPSNGNGNGGSRGTSRRRSVVACWKCNQRKVRCDVAKIGLPCSNCLHDELGCEVLPRKKHRYDAVPTPLNWLTRYAL